MNDFLLYNNVRNLNILHFNLGLAGCAFVAVYGLYRYKNRGNLSASNYLMQLRVTAQGTVIACLTLGIMKSLYDRLSKKDTPDS